MVQEDQLNVQVRFGFFRFKPTVLCKRLMAGFYWPWPVVVFLFANNERGSEKNLNCWLQSEQSQLSSSLGVDTESQKPYTAYSSVLKLFSFDYKESFRIFTG